MGINYVGVDHQRVNHYNLIFHGYPENFIKFTEEMNTYDLYNIIRTMWIRYKYKVMDNMRKELKLYSLTDGIFYSLNEDTNKLSIIDHREDIVPNKIGFDYIPTRTDLLKNPTLFKIISENRI